jgi:catechol 2,3-dioxygenase-like lactoylglutathione lyase family enzyme
MNFVSVRIIASDVKLMVEFYEQVTGLPARWATDDFAELVTPAGTLAIASARTIEMFGAGAAVPASNHTVIIEFRVDDVDRDFARLQDLVAPFVQEPTTMPWGNRSILFRDPDGNLVNLFTPLSPDALERFGGLRGQG